MRVTFIEVMIIVAIIAILFIVAIPGAEYSRASTEAQKPTPGIYCVLGVQGYYTPTTNTFTSNNGHILQVVDHSILEAC